MHIFSRKGMKKETWILDYYVEVDGVLKRRQESFSDKKTAEKAMWKRRLEIEEGKFLDKKQRKTSRITLPELADKYLEWSKVNKRSWDRDELSIMHLLKFFGKKPLSQINPFLIEKYKQERKNTVSPRTVDLELACLRHMFSKAIEWELVRENPVKRVKFFRVDNQNTRYLTIEEYGQLVEACPTHLKPLVIIAFNTGMRKGELLNLTWDDLDLLNGIIYVRMSKSGEGRKIPMNEAVRTTLTRLKANSICEHVFTTPAGSKLKEPRVGYTLALRRAKIESANFHTLRQYAESRIMPTFLTRPRRVAQELSCDSA